MASGEVLKRLLKSFKEGDRDSFLKAAEDLIKEEQMANHHSVARDLKRILADAEFTDASRVNTLGFFQLPRDKEKGTPLVEIRFPQKFLHEIILEEELKKQMDVTIQEYRFQSVLRANGLEPRQKLLFAGPPGCGKTLASEVIATELGLPLLHVRFDSLVSSYLGETATNLGKVFDFAKKSTWLIFFDEFDAIGKSRDDSSDHGELKRVVNAFLQLLDGFDSEGIIAAATNHEHLLDDALWRRFDDIMYFPLPRISDIEKLLKLKLQNVRHLSIDFNRYSKLMGGWSYADIERVCLESMKIMLLNEKRVLTEDDINEAISRQQRRVRYLPKQRLS